MANRQSELKRAGPLPRKLSDAQVEAIRYHYAGMKHTEVGRLFGVSGWTVSKIRRGLKHKRRVQDSRGVVIYQAPPPELVERADLDIWFVRRGRALLRGYATALERLEKEGRFEEPRPEEWQVDDEYGRDGFPTSPRFAAERLAERARKFLQEAGPRPRQRPEQDQGGPVVSAGEPDVPNLLYDPKGRFR